MNPIRILLLLFFSICTLTSFSQFRPEPINWTPEGNSFLFIREGNIVKINLETNNQTIIVNRNQLIPEGASQPLSFDIYSFSADNKSLLIFTNTAKVWRYHTRGDYWVLNLVSNQLTQLGKSLPPQSLMFAKISPDGKMAAYVSEHNLYEEDISTHEIRALTKDGTRKFINGTFDWVYEEEFGCRDGFRWSPDSKKIAFWQVDATKVRDYYMLNTTDSPYSRIIPVEYPKVGQSPSPVRIGIITVSDNAVKWMDVPGDPQEHYIPRMEWADNSSQLVLQQLNRKQNESKLFYCDINTGVAKNFYTETDKAFIDIKSRWNDDDPTGWDWIDHGKEFLWVSEKDGWRHIYLISRDGKETLVTNGNYDIDDIKCIDDKNGYVYFMASPNNATQLYLYRTKLDGKGALELLSPAELKGTHNYNISPGARFARHSFSNYKTFPVSEWISLPDGKPLDEENSIAKNMRVNENSNIEYFKVTTEDNITLDGWMVKPANFDSTKKYPVVFYVYGEPASSTIADRYGAQDNPYRLFNGDMSNEGYFQISVDNRGTPSLRGSKWRKSIYGQIGRLNIHDQAMAAKKILEKPYFDKDRVAVWGWSGGGSSTLNLMFQYPEIYKTGISIAAVTNLLFYDNIYEERYMGLIPGNKENYILGSPIHYAKHLQGNLLFIHGTGDDNVQYDNAEELLNVLIQNNKQFQFMPFPNRTHSLSEGEGTRKFLSTLYTDYLRKNCPPGARPR
ncbi:MAG: DPP IV N-terminal domain-containing protein [Bacteroidota bacterium]|nr:DPP IV N-terminal domain-containing protein [Bacteroidota bacterium]